MSPFLRCSSARKPTFVWNFGDATFIWLNIVGKEQNWLVEPIREMGGDKGLKQQWENERHGEHKEVNARSGSLSTFLVHLTQAKLRLAHEFYVLLPFESVCLHLNSRTNFWTLHHNTASCFQSAVTLSNHNITIHLIDIKLSYLKWYFIINNLQIKLR